MCLYYATRIYKKPIKSTRRAWKIVKRIGETGLYQTIFQRTPVSGSWQRCGSKKWERLPCEQGDQAYPTGFHSYATEKDADKALRMFKGEASWQDRSGWVVVPCLVRDVVAVGYDGSAGIETANLRNVVSKRIKVLLPKN